jgi:hypothetical protein
VAYISSDGHCGDGSPPPMLILRYLALHCPGGLQFICPGFYDAPTPGIIIKRILLKVHCPGGLQYIRPGRYYTPAPVTIPIPLTTSLQVLSIEYIKPLLGQWALFADTPPISLLFPCYQGDGWPAVMNVATHKIIPL